jgi:hypothetical protein
VIAAGQTWSADFPLSDSAPQPTGYSEAFVIKLATSVPTIEAVQESETVDVVVTNNGRVSAGAQVHITSEK